MFALFVEGLLIGFAVAAPVGPIGILCIQRSLHDGFKVGLMTGLGAALADGTYGLIAGFGVTALTSVLLNYQFEIRLIGGLFLLYLGIKLFLSSPPKKLSSNSERSAWHALSTTFVLTLMNPATILAFLAVFAGLGVNTTSIDYLHALVLVFSITLGSALWWFALSGAVAFIVRHRLSPIVMLRINRFSGAIIFAFGIFALSMQ